MNLVFNYLFEDYDMSLFAVTNIFPLFNLKMIHIIKTNFELLQIGMEMGIGNSILR